MSKLADKSFFFLFSCASKLNMFVFFCGQFGFGTYDGFFLKIILYISSAHTCLYNINKTSILEKFLESS